jgi:hypothetical protein
MMEDACSLHSIQEAERKVGEVSQYPLEGHASNLR